MNGIQIVLMTGILIVCILFVMKARIKRLYIVFSLAVALLSMTFILWPNITTRLARIMGVGRGADLIFYISIVVFSYVLVHLFGRIRKLEEMTTELIRRDALNSASNIPVNMVNNDAQPKS